MNNWTEDEKAIATEAVANYRIAQAAQARMDAAIAYHLTLKVGDEVTFRDSYTWGDVSGIVIRRGTAAGWAMVNGTETRFDATDLIF